MRTDITERLENFARRRGMALLALLGLCLVVYLPGMLRLPPVDRTEVIWADTTRAMHARGTFADPRYADQVHAFRPVGTFWAQAASLALAGEAYARDIRIYRVPGVIAVTLSVLALYLLAGPLVGPPAAFVAAVLFAVAPLTVLLSQLAIAEGLSLLPATIAVMTLARLYTARAEQDTRRLAVLFWGALGVGVAINALLVPILVAATVLALYVLDRDLSWLRRLWPSVGLPVALLLASPWMVVRAAQDGVPFSGLEFKEVLAALGGAQDMKLRAMPGTFILALLLGFLPGTALLAPAVRRLWDTRRENPLGRFLLASLAGYLVYLEALSSKPGTYMVQTMFPSLALAVALVVRESAEGAPPPRWHAFPWPPLAALFALALLAGPYVFAGEPPSLAALVLMTAVAVLFASSAADGRRGRLRQWAIGGPAALALFAVTLLGVTLPNIDKLWPARALSRVVESCPPATVALVGFREPSARFLLDVAPALQSPEAAAAVIGEKTPRLTIVEDRALRRVQSAIESERQVPLPPPAACVAAYNVMRGCPLHFRVYETGAGAACAFPPEFACLSPLPDPPATATACD